jgi:hypothetical protein
LAGVTEVEVVAATLVVLVLRTGASGSGSGAALARVRRTGLTSASGSGSAAFAGAFTALRAAGFLTTGASSAAAEALALEEVRGLRVVVVVLVPALVLVLRVAFLLGISSSENNDGFSVGSVITAINCKWFVAANVRRVSLAASKG